MEPRYEGHAVTFHLGIVPELNGRIAVSNDVPRLADVQAFSGDDVFEGLPAEARRRFRRASGGGRPWETRRGAARASASAPEKVTGRRRPPAAGAPVVAATSSGRRPSAPGSS